MSLWINQGHLLWPAVVAALMVSFASRTLASVRRRLARIAWNRLITIELHVTVRAPGRKR